MTSQTLHNFTVLNNVVRLYRSDGGGHYFINAVLMDFTNSLVANNNIKSLSGGSLTHIYKGVGLTSNIDVHDWITEDGNYFRAKDTLDLDGLVVGEGTNVLKMIKSGSDFLIITATDTIVLDSLRSK